MEALFSAQHEHCTCRGSFNARSELNVSASQERGEERRRDELTRRRCERGGAGTLHMVYITSAAITSAAITSAAITSAASTSAASTSAASTSAASTSAAEADDAGDGPGGSTIPRGDGADHVDSVQIATGGFQRLPLAYRPGRPCYRAIRGATGGRAAIERSLPFLSSVFRREAWLLYTVVNGERGQRLEH